MVKRVELPEEEEYDPLHPSIGNVASVVKVTQRHYSVPEDFQPKPGVFMRAVQEAQRSVDRGGTVL